MGDFKEFKNKVTITIDEEYEQNGDIVREDDLIIGAIKYLRSTGKSADFLGFDVLNRHIILINNEKYCLISWDLRYPKIILKKADMEVKENRFIERVNKIWSN